MSNQIVQLFSDGDSSSPFDRIKQHRADGVEFWSGRDLMELLGYDSWRRFEDAIERAKRTADNQGMSLADLFAGAVKKSEGGRPASDVLLTRYAAYLVALNGDPRKPEVAAAQSYFATRTREAEVSPQPTMQLPQSYAAALRELADTAEREEQERIEKERERDRRLQLEGPAAERDFYRSTEGLQTIGDVANRFKAYAADRYPNVRVLNKDVWEHAARLGIIIRGNTVRHNQPTSRAIEANWARPSESTHETNTRGTVRTVTTRLMPRGESRLWDGLVKHIETHGDLVIRSKEIAA